MPMWEMRQDTSAAGAVIVFMVAAMIFLGAITGLMLYGSEAGQRPEEDPVADARSGIAADGLAAILVDSAGVGWAAGPDGITRLGIMAENGSGLDPDALDALRGAMYESTDNDKVDYEDALASLGMDRSDGSGFHLRIYPIGLDEMAIDPDLSVGYIADWSALASVKVAPPVLTAEAMAVKANTQLNLSMVAGTVYERQALRSLGVDYTDRVHITAATPTILVDYAFPLPDLPLMQVLGTLHGITLLEGDVYPDDKAYLEAVLPGRLAEYDVIVVGSGVDHSKLTKNTIKDGIRDWVLAGGTLIVLGSADKSTAWLNPLLNAGISTVNGAAIAPDVAHPLLKEPNDLDWPSYDTHDTGWDIQDTGAVAAYDDFSHVVLQGAEDVLAVSKAGAFGDGRVILTNYYPRDIAPTLSQAEANDFMENMVSYSDRSSLYLDYGGSIPGDQAVALAIRQSWLWDETYGQVPVTVEVLTWGGKA